MANELPRQKDLDQREKREARQRQAPSAAVVFEAIRSTAEAELHRSRRALAWSALAAGLSMGFSFIAQALLYHHTPASGWQTIVSSLGYSVGFLFVILGRQQLFTENTLAPVLEVFRAHNRQVVGSTLTLWAVVLLGNLLGTSLFAAVLAFFDVADPSVESILREIAAKEYEYPTGTMFVRAIFAGWLVALMLWLLPFAETARVLVIVMVTFVIGLAHFPHVVAGSVAALYAVFTGMHSIGDFIAVFFLPTIAGNMVGGIMLVAAINFGQVVYGSEEMQ